MADLTLEEAAAMCDKVRWQGKDTFTACCLAHDDRNPSMSVSERNGKLLFYCHAGCPQDELVHAFGLRRARPHLRIVTPSCPKTGTSTIKYAQALWAAAGDGVASHPYAIRKRITHEFGALRGKASGRLIGKNADCIIVPNRNWEGELIGVECINADGVKQTFGRKGLLILGCPEDALLIHVCEGWATAWALSQLFSHRFGCIVAFGKSRMAEIADDAQFRYRGHDAVIAHGDDSRNRDVWDGWVAGTGDKIIEKVMGDVYGR